MERSVCCVFCAVTRYILFLQSFQSKLSFSSKEIVALSCSWCKTAYHNKESCFNLQKIGEECNLGKSTKENEKLGWQHYLSGMVSQSAGVCSCMLKQ